MLRVNSRSRWSSRTPGSRHILVGIIISASVAAGIAVVWLANILPIGLSILVVCLSGLVVWMLAAFRHSAFGRDFTLFQYLGACCIVVGTAMISFNALRAGADMSDVMIADIFLLIGTILLVPLLFNRRSLSQGKPVWLIVAASLLSISGMLSAISATDIEPNLIVTVRFTIALLGVPLILGVTASSPARFAFMTDIWLSFVAFNAAIAFLDFLGVTSIGPTLSSNLFVGRFAGLTAHPNHLTLACTMALPVALSLASIARKPLRGAFYIHLVISLVLGVFVSGSRAGLLAGIFGIGFVPFYQRYARKGALFILGIGAVTILLVSSYLETDSGDIFIGIQRLTGAVSVGESDVGRLEYYSEALSDFIANPLVGQGFSNVRTAHNIYLQLLQAGGLIAFLAFALFAFGTLHLGWRLMHKSTLTTEMKNLAGALTASMLVWLLVGLVQNQMYDRFLYVPAGLMLGLQLVSIGRFKVFFSPLDRATVKPDQPFVNTSVLVSR